MKNFLKILIFTIILTLTLGFSFALCEENEENQRPENDTLTLNQRWAGCTLNYFDLLDQYNQAAIPFISAVKSRSIIVTSKGCLTILKTDMVIAAAGEDCLALGALNLATNPPNKKFITQIDKKIEKGVSTFRKMIDRISKLCLKIKDFEESHKPKQEIY